ncbi:MAG TPA: hypothetical protein VFZ61_00130 [Polyangiales bacterium]
MRSTAIALTILASLSGCEPPEAPAHAELEASEALLSPARAPALEHGDVWFGARVEADFQASAYQAWSFELARPATLRLETEASATGPDLDTLLYLYRQSGAGWGAYVARNDDRSDSRFSRLERSLAPGRYRVVVKGPKAPGNSFVLAAYCEGPDCNQPVQPERCVFGEKLADTSGLLALSTIVTMQGKASAVDKLLPQQLVAAAQLGPLRSVETPAQLFRVVDSGLVRWFRIWDHAASRDFRAVEFRFDGRSYGAIFPNASLQPAALVRDGKLRECSTPVQRCALGTTYHELRDNPAYTLHTSAKVTASNVDTLDQDEQAQLLAAVQVAYEETADLAAALASVDQGEVNQLWFTPKAGGTSLVAYEYGAGDNSYGGVFPQGSPQLVARINDGDLIDCKLLE